MWTDEDMDHLGAVKASHTLGDGNCDMGISNGPREYARIEVVHG